MPGVVSLGIFPLILYIRFYMGIESIVRWSRANEFCGARGTHSPHLGIPLGSIHTHVISNPHTHSHIEHSLISICGINKYKVVISSSAAFCGVPTITYQYVAEWTELSCKGIHSRPHKIKLDLRSAGFAFIVAIQCEPYWAGTMSCNAVRSETALPSIRGKSSKYTRCATKFWTMNWFFLNFLIYAFRCARPKPTI